MSEKETVVYNLDAPFTGCASTLLFLMFGPLLVWIGMTVGRGGPQNNPTVHFDRGATAMCYHIVQAAGMPANQHDAFCAQMNQQVNP